MVINQLTPDQLPPLHLTQLALFTHTLDPRGQKQRQHLLHIQIGLGTLGETLDEIRTLPPKPNGPVSTLSQNLDPVR